MTNAKIDENRKPTLIALSSEDGETIELVNAKNNRMMVVDGGTGPAEGGGVNAKIDENSRSTMTVLSSAGDGTIINLYVDPATKRLLIQS